MAHTIEVAGEANPLSYDNVVHTLGLAAGSVQHHLQSGTTQLQNWSKQPSYHSFLQDAFCDTSLPYEYRYLAIIQLKNGIDKYWRKTAPKFVTFQASPDKSLPCNPAHPAHPVTPDHTDTDIEESAIGKDEKQKIKTTALQAGFMEPDAKLALQNALMIAKILRFEFPQDWPEAMHIILESLRSSTQPGANPLQLSRTLIILLQVIKELSTARLQRTRLQLQSLSPEILQVLGNIYLDKVNTWASMLEQGLSGAELLDAIEQSLVCIKVLRRLVIAGFEHPARNAEVEGFWSLTHDHFVKFFSFVNEPRASKLHESVHRLVQKHIIQLAKFHVDMSKTHAASFARFGSSISLVTTYWTLLQSLSEVYVSLGADTEAEGQSLAEKAGLRALLLIRACAQMAFNPVHTFKYQTPEDKEEKKLAVERIRTELFTEKFVLETMELLVTKFFKFRSVDFEDWEADPESWEKQEEANSASWEFSIRPCSEKLFLDLIIHFKDLLVGRLLDVFYSFARVDNRDVIMKDSLYSAVGIAAASLEQNLDFNSFLESTVVSEVQIHDQEYRLLRRRIPIIIAQWVPIQYEKFNIDAVYQIFQHLLNKEDPLNDLVVRITAGRQLGTVLDSYEFKAAGFIPYAPSILRSLMDLVNDVDLPETQMGLLETVRVLVVKMEHHISPFADDILSLLPPLWEESGDEHLMKQAILTLLSSLIHALKDESSRYHSLILPLIQASVDPESESFHYLLDEALEMWAAIIMQTPSPATPEILSLMPSLFAIIELGIDNAAQALNILESYILLAPQEALRDDFRDRILTTLKVSLSYGNKIRTGVVPRLVELMIRGAQAVDDGSKSTYGVIAHSLVGTEFLQTLLQGLYTAFEASQTTGPNRKVSNVVGVVETDYFSVLARLALADPTIMASAVAVATQTSEEQALDWILSEWFSHYDNIGSTSQKKLHALALTSLLALPGPPQILLNNLQSFFTIWTDIVVELADGSEEPDADYLVSWHAPGGSETAAPENSEEVETPENRRTKEWAAADPVHQLRIREFVRKHLEQVINACGGAQRFQENWLVSVDATVVSAFGDLGLI